MRKAYNNQDVNKAVRAVIYIRYSSHRQTDSFSIEYQYDECMKYLQQKGYKFVKRYVDEAKSGKKTAGREAFDEMIYDASQSKFDKIIVFSFSRSFRNTRDALNYSYELMETHGVVIESVIERIDLTNPHGKFSGTNLFAMHELQADIIAAHVRSGMYVAAKQGYYLGGYVPYGYRLYETGEMTRGKARKKYEPHPEEKEIVKQMFQMYADGFSLDYIQGMLKDKGVKGRKGDVIGIQTIARIFKSPFYIGTREYSIKGYDKINIENAVPAIIDMNLWYAVQAKHEKNALPAPRKTKRLYALTGKIYCAKCNEKSHLFGTYKGDSRNENWSYSYYVCSNKKSRKTCDLKNIRKDMLEQYCIDEIKKYILNPESIKTIAEYIVDLAGEAPTDIQAEYEKLSVRKEKIKGILKKAKRDELEGEDGAAEIYQELSAEYSAELADIDIKLYQLEAAANTAITPEAVEKYLNEMLLTVDTDDEHLLKAIFDKLIDKVVVYDDRVELFLIVCPYPHVRDKKSKGQPKYKLSLTADRKIFSAENPTKFKKKH